MVVTRWVFVLALAFGVPGCLSWTQPAPPDRSTWHVPGQRCDRSYGAPFTAGMLATAAGAGSIAIAATTERGDLEDLEERSFMLLLVPVAIGYTVDALIALGDTRSCRAYHRHQSTGRLTAPNLLRQGPGDERRRGPTD